MTDSPPNNPLKLPVGVLGIVGSAFLIAYGAAESRWGFFAPGVVLFVIGCAQVRAIVQGRNPWWNRAPIDYQRDPSKRKRRRHE